MIVFKDNKIKFTVAFLVAGLILSGCGATSPSTESGDSTQVNKRKSAMNRKTYTAEVGLTPRQRFSKALEKLENGEDGQALAELKAYLLSVPKSNSARNLVAQITTDSSEYFPSEHFTINLTSGASLSTLAKRYLGSALKFYALAKYNNIANPSRVNIGQKIKIPLTQLARTKRDKAVETESSNTDNNDLSVDLVLAEDVEDFVDEVDVVEVEAIDEIGEAAVIDVVDEGEDLIEAPELTDVEPVLVEAIPVAPVETAESALRDLQELTQNKDYAAAIEKVTTLSNFGTLNKVSRKLAIETYTGRAKEIAVTDNVLAAKYFTEAGQLNLQQQQTFNAFNNFKMATDLDENNELVMEEMLVLQKEIADKYHREASSAFRRQELDLAIENWDRVLKVDPDHSSAKLYRAQALELKEKLYKINQN